MTKAHLPQLRTGRDWHLTTMRWPRITRWVFPAETTRLRSWPLSTISTRKVSSRRQRWRNMLSVPISTTRYLLRLISDWTWPWRRLTITGSGTQFLRPVWLRRRTCPCTTKTATIRSAMPMAWSCSITRLAYWMKRWTGILLSVRWIMLLSNGRSLKGWSLNLHSVSISSMQRIKAIIPALSIPVANEAERLRNRLPILIHGLMKTSWLIRIHGECILLQDWWVIRSSLLRMTASTPVHTVSWMTTCKWITWDQVRLIRLRVRMWRNGRWILIWHVSTIRWTISICWLPLFVPTVLPALVRTTVGDISLLPLWLGELPKNRSSKTWISLVIWNRESVSVLRVTRMVSVLILLMHCWVRPVM